MATASDVAAVLQRAGPRLLQGDRKTLQDIELRLSDTDFRGIAIVATARANTSADKTLPVVIAVQKTVLRGWEVMEQDNLALALLDLDTGDLQIAPVLVDPKAAEHPLGPPTRPAKPSREASDAVMTKLYHLDARERLNVPWREGSFALTALAFDWVSNTARIAIEGTPARPAPKAATVSPLPVAGAALPMFDPTPRHPQPPPAGVDFKIEATTTGSYVALGAFNRPARAADLLATPQSLPAAGGAKTAFAAARMTLAVVGLDQRAANLARWSIPVFASAPLAPGQPMTGHFAIDLRAAGALGGPGQYAAYIFMEADVYGPRRFQVK